jgi:hypothetical protein
VLLCGPGLIPGKVGCFPLATISILSSLPGTEYRWLLATRRPQHRCDHTPLCSVSVVPFTVRYFEAILAFHIAVIYVQPSACQYIWIHSTLAQVG